MKKISTFCLFLLVFLASVFYIVSEIKRVETDIFALVNFKENKREFQLLKSMQKDFSNEFLFMSDSKEFALKAEKTAFKFSIFDEFNATTNINLSNYLDEINRLKMAMLSKEIYQEIVGGSGEFFKKNAESFFNQFAFKPLSPNDDFFGFSSHLSVDDSKVSLDLSSLMLRVKDENRDFYLIKARLKNGYDHKKLIKFYEEIKAWADKENAEAFISSGALYSAFAKDRGDKESLYMSLVSLFLSSALFLLAFRNFNIFFIIFVAIFGFACGFAASLAVFASVHIMVVVIGTSLVGLMFDFALHWLGKSQNIKISRYGMRPMLGIFLLGLVITMSGYGVFVFAKLEILKQIAVFSFFTLFGAFLFTYFCLPLILEGKIFTQSKIFTEILNKFEEFCLVFAGKIGIKFVSLLAIFLASVLLLNLSNLITTDNIKEYSSSPDELLLQSKKISELSGLAGSSLMIVVKNGNDLLQAENKLLSELKAENLVKNHESISKIFLTQSKQESIKDAFKKAKNDPKMIEIYTNLGFDEDMINKEFDKVSQIKTLSLDEILKFDIAKDFKRFLLDENSSVIYAKNFTNNDKSDEILASNDAFVVDFLSALNQNFTEAKASAAMLKLIAFCLAFVLLWVFFGALKASLVMSLITLGVMSTLCVFVLFDMHINIFVVFGLILASAVGIDYMIFALNKNLSVNERIFGIMMAAVTSFISFFMLTFSTTGAISLFGLSVSLCVAFYALAASVLSARNL